MSNLNISIARNAFGLYTPGGKASPLVKPLLFLPPYTFNGSFITIPADDDVIKLHKSIRIHRLLVDNGIRGCLIGSMIRIITEDEAFVAITIPYGEPCWLSTSLDNMSEAQNVWLSSLNWRTLLANEIMEETINENTGK